MHYEFNKRKFIIILCGPGKNGGDGFVIARHLIKSEYNIRVYTFADINSYIGDALRALKDLKGVTKKISLFKLEKDTLIVDALFGIGLKRNITGKLKKYLN